MLTSFFHSDQFGFDLVMQDNKAGLGKSKHLDKLTSFIYSAWKEGELAKLGVAGLLSVYHLWHAIWKRNF